MRTKKVDAQSASFPVLQQIILPKPAFPRAKSLFVSLQQRITIREISDRPLALPMLSNLLWAANGVNRKKGPFGIPGRTAASASNSQEIDLYVVLNTGVYLYDAIHHALAWVVADDYRSLTIGKGQPDYIVHAPVHLVYIADIHKLAHTAGYQEPGLKNHDIQKSYYHVDTGIIAGNVYLFAASFGLASWFHNCDKISLSAKLKLRADQRVLFGHTVGYPVK